MGSGPPVSLRDPTLDTRRTDLRAKFEANRGEFTEQTVIEFDTQLDDFDARAGKKGGKDFLQTHELDESAARLDEAIAGTGVFGNRRKRAGELKAVRDRPGGRQVRAGFKPIFLSAGRGRK